MEGEEIPRLGLQVFSNLAIIICVCTSASRMSDFHDRSNASVWCRIGIMES